MRPSRFILWTTMAVFLLTVQGTGATPVPSAPEHVGVVQFANLNSVLFNPGSRFKHVVVIIQENRSFDNLFNGFRGANTVRYGKTHTGASVALKPTPFEGPYDPNHEHSAWVADYDRGRMDGFDLPPTTPAGPPNFNYGYVPQAETVPYFEMAKEFAIADRNFAAETGPSFRAISTWSPDSRIMRSAIPTIPYFVGVATHNRARQRPYYKQTASLISMARSHALIMRHWLTYWMRNT